MKILEHTDQYDLIGYDDLTRLTFLFTDESKNLLGDFITDFPQTCICELIEAVRKIEQGHLDRYALNQGLYSFTVDYAGICIVPSGEARHAGINFNGPGSYSLTELKETLDLYCEKFMEVFGADLREVDEDYAPLIEGVIDDYPAKEVVEANKRFPDNEDR